MRFIEDDAGTTYRRGDCAVRALSLLTGKPYGKVLRRMNRIYRSAPRLSKNPRERALMRVKVRFGCAHGTWSETFEKFCEEEGLVRANLRGTRPWMSSFPKRGAYVADVLGGDHCTVIKNGVNRDTFDCTGYRVYSCWGYPRDIARLQKALDSRPARSLSASPYCRA